MVTNFDNGLAIDGYQIAAFATIDVAAEDSNDVAVTIQLYADEAGNVPLANVAAVEYWLSDDSGGAGVAATAPDGGIAIGTDGVLNELVSGKAGYLVSEADGDIDIVVTESGSDTFYLVLKLPTGRLIVSDALTFAGA